MASESIADRLSKLRALRQKLCSKEKNWTEAFQARDWLVNQLNHLHTMTSDNQTTMNDIRDRVADLLCVLDPENNNGCDDV